MVEHILVGFDGSESSRKAVRFAHDLAVQTHAKLTLVFVLELPHVLPIGPLDSYLVTGSARAPEEIKAVQRLLDEVAADLPAVSVDRRVEIGRPADVLCEQAEQCGADLIVVGARGVGLGGRWLLGSVSDRVVHHAGRPVVVVH